MVYSSSILTVKGFFFSGKMWICTMCDGSKELTPTESTIGSKVEGKIESNVKELQGTTLSFHLRTSWLGGRERYAEVWS